MTALVARLVRRAAGVVESLRVRPLVAVGRAALWAAVGLVLLRGTVSFLPEASAKPEPARAAAAASAIGYPEARALAFASRFVTDYLSFDEAAPDLRRARVSQYLAEGVGGDWVINGTQRVTQALPVDADVRSPQLAVVTVAAQVGERWLHLAVAVAADDAGRLAVAASPTFVAGPGRAAVVKPDMPEADPEATARGAPALEAFFRAYGAGTEADLAYYLAPGRTLPGLGGAVAFQGLSEVRVGPGPGARDATATVTWATPSGTLTQTYALRLVESDGRFYVDDIGPVIPAAKTKENTNDR